MYNKIKYKWNKLKSMVYIKASDAIHYNITNEQLINKLVI